VFTTTTDGETTEDVLTEPSLWPPAVGDIWELDDVEYVGLASEAYPGMIFLRATATRDLVYGTELRDFARCFPRLLRRSGVTDLGHWQ
jgi:hypothetical protein